jgi:C_GCAxxG_C_C family probable redox protein
MSATTEQAVSLFKQGFNCSQAVLTAYCEKLGLGRSDALKIACGFGGGMHVNGTCGAVTGAIMAIGLKYGTSIPDKNTRTQTYKLVAEFAKEFNANNGSINCTELLGCDLSTSEGMKTAQEKKLFSTVCPKMVQSATEILDHIFSH